MGLTLSVCRVLYRRGGGGGGGGGEEGWNSAPLSSHIVSPSRNTNTNDLAMPLAESSHKNLKHFLPCNIQDQLVMTSVVSIRKGQPCPTSKW